jgi:hypothetical protein
LKKKNMRLLRAAIVAALVVQTAALSIGGKNMVVKKDSDGLQDIVSDTARHWSRWA